MEYSIKLKFGYRDKKGTAHRSVTFGRRLTAGDIILIDNDPTSQNATQYTDNIRRKVITKFGDLTTPVPIDVLLSLNSIDRQDLQRGLDKFLELSREDRPSGYQENNVVQIRFGFDIEGTKYTVVELGRTPTGHDEVEASAIGLTGVAYECFMLGRRITKLSTESGVSIDGPVDPKHFNDLDAEDLNLLRIGAQMADMFFRYGGESDDADGDGEGGADPEEGDGPVGSGDPPDAGGEDGNVLEGLD